ncbi:hypothetical protein WJX77_005171 [Trebouxia sp. C0004]
MLTRLYDLWVTAAKIGSVRRVKLQDGRTVQHGRFRCRRIFVKVTELTSRSGLVSSSCRHTAQDELLAVS